MAKGTFSVILLLAEGTDEGMQAARTAIELAADEEAVLEIVSVLDTNTLKQLLTYRIFVKDEMDEYEQELEVSCSKQLGYVAHLADKARVKNNAVLLKGPCHVVVLQEQQRVKADLLVMGAFRTSTVRTDLMAREKQMILDEAPCPVLLVPAARR